MLGSFIPSSFYHFLHWSVITSPSLIHVFTYYLSRVLSLFSTELLVQCDGCLGGSAVGVVLCSGHLLDPIFLKLSSNSFTLFMFNSLSKLISHLNIMICIISLFVWIFIFLFFWGGVKQEGYGVLITNGNENHVKKNKHRRSIRVGTFINNKLLILN